MLVLLFGTFHPLKINSTQSNLFFSRSYATIKLFSDKECAIAISNTNEDLSFSNKQDKSKFKHLKCLKHDFSYKINTTNKNLFKRNYKVLTFPLHKGIRRHTVSKPCQTQNNNKQISFLLFFYYNLEISEYTHTHLE